MTNKEAFKRFDEAQGAVIDKLIWIAGASNRTSEIKEFLEDMRAKDIEQCFPEVYADEYFNDYFNENGLYQLIWQYEKFGLLAEVHVPEPRNIRFDKSGKPTSWSTGGISTMVYVYAETLEELMQKIEVAVNDEFQYQVKKAKEQGKKKDKIK